MGEDDAQFRGGGVEHEVGFEMREGSVVVCVCVCAGWGERAEWQCAMHSARCVLTSHSTRMLCVVRPAGDA